MMKTIIRILSIIVAGVLLTGCSGSGLSAHEDTEKKEAFLAELKETVNQEVAGFGETITEIALEKKTINIDVDLSAADSSVYSEKDIAETVFFIITAAALEVNDYDDMWDKISVSFGETGSITKSKEDIREGINGRAFDYGAGVEWD